jgi:heat shock protein 1/8
MEIVEDEFNNYFGINSCSDEESINSNEYQNQEEEEEEEEDIIIGIDLGTTNSCVGIWRNNNLEIIPDSYGYRTIPSVVAFTNKTRYIGREGKNQTDINPENTYFEVKRLIGRKYTDDSVKNDIQFLTYELGNDENDNVILKSDLSNRKKNITPEEISAYILMELKHMAEDYLKRHIDKAVITVPAYFNDAQRQATKDAATIAGLECVRIINEPTAAALSYGLQRLSQNKEDDLNVLVYDLGGGTLDVSLLNISDGVFEVLGSTGNTHLGGVDFDNALVTYCKNKFKIKHKINKLADLSLLSLQKLKKSCENSKKILSETGKATITVKEFYNDKHLMIQITRKQLDTICRDLLILCMKPVDDVLKSCDLTRDDIDEIILVGGATRMPAIRNNIKLFFKGKEPCCNVNPDEVVAAGAAIQGYILSHKKDPFAESIVLLDIIPLSLGVETIGNLMTSIIPRNSVIPIKRTKKFTTDQDYEDSVNIKIFEGERQMTKDNFFVGEFILKGLEKAPRGIAEIDVAFTIDINGIISVTAIDKKNEDNKHSINVTGNKGRLKADDIKKLVTEARDLEKKDKIEREKRQSFYQIEDMCSNIKLNIENDEFKLKEKDKELIMEEINKIYGWLELKKYLDRTPKEYFKVLTRLNKKYGTLILRTSHDQEDIKAKGESTHGTSVYGNKDDEELSKELYEQLENEDLGINNMDSDEREELKNIRDSLIETCQSIFEIINSGTLNIKESDVKDLRDYIDDVLLWTHVVEKISKIQYKQKIDEINETCNKLFEDNSYVFEENLITKSIKTTRNELEQLCFALKSSISSNLFSVDEEHMSTLDSKINEVLDWLLDLDVMERKCEIENTQFNIEEIEYQQKIDDINELCNKLYSEMMGVNINRMNEDVLDDSVIYMDNKTELSKGTGTTLDSLRTLED